VDLVEQQRHSAGVRPARAHRRDRITVAEGVGVGADPAVLDGAAGVAAVARGGVAVVTALGADAVAVAARGEAAPGAGVGAREAALDLAGVVTAVADLRAAVVAGLAGVEQAVATRIGAGDAGGRADLDGPVGRGVGVDERVDAREAAPLGADGGGRVDEHEACHGVAAAAPGDAVDEKPAPGAVALDEDDLVAAVGEAAPVGRAPAGEVRGDGVAWRGVGEGDDHGTRSDGDLCGVAGHDHRLAGRQGHRRQRQHHLAGAGRVLLVPDRVVGELDRRRPGVVQLDPLPARLGAAGIVEDLADHELGAGGRCAERAATGQRQGDHAPRRSPRAFASPRAHSPRPARPMLLSDASRSPLASTRGGSRPEAIPRGKLGSGPAGPGARRR